MISTRYGHFFWFLFILFILFGYRVQASTNTFSVFPYPAVTNKYFFTLSSSKTLDRYQYFLNLTNRFAWHSLNMIDASGARVGSVVDYYTVHALSGRVGLGRIGDFGLGFPLFGVVRFDDPDDQPDRGAENLAAEPGDLYLSFRTNLSQLTSINLGDKFGIALEPFMTIPLGSNTHYIGDNETTGGLKAIFDFKPLERLLLAFNIGPEFRERVQINNIDFHHRLLSAFGVFFNIGSGFSTSAEVLSKTPFGHFYSQNATAPVEFNGSLQWQVPSSDFRLGLGGGTCGICSSGAAKANGFLSVSFSPESSSSPTKK